MHAVNSQCRAAINHHYSAENESSDNDIREDTMSGGSGTDELAEQQTGIWCLSSSGMSGAPSDLDDPFQFAVT